LLKPTLVNDIFEKRDIPQIERHFNPPNT